MVFASSLYGGSGIPVGDKIRFGTATLVPANTTTTLLTVASGGGLLHSIWVNDIAADVDLTNIKVTIDGASERTLDASATTIALIAYESTVGRSGVHVLPLPISFATSLTLKVTTTAGSTQVGMMAVYSVL